MTQSEGTKSLPFFFDLVSASEDVSRSLHDGNCGRQDRAKPPTPQRVGETKRRRQSL